MALAAYRSLLISAVKRARLSVALIHATEVDPPEGRKPIDWKLLTDLPVESANQAIENGAWYSMRWKIKLFFKIKSGFNAEKLRRDMRLMPPAYVKPYVKRGKTDAADAEAICEAVTRPTMRFVAVKSPSSRPS